MQVINANLDYGRVESRSHDFSSHSWNFNVMNSNDLVTIFFLLSSKAVFIELKIGRLIQILFFFIQREKLKLL